MEKLKNVTHGFELTGMGHGDWFLGCPNCWFRLETRTAAPLVCPICNGKLSLYDVTEDDLIKCSKQ